MNAISGNAPRSNACIKTIKTRCYHNKFIAYAFLIVGSGETCPCAIIFSSLSLSFCIFISVFCLFYGVDGLLRERGFELLGVLVAIIIILLYLTTNFIYHMVLIYIKGSEPKFHGGELAVRIVRHRKLYSFKVF